VLFQDEHLLVVIKLGNELTVAAGGGGKLPLFDFLKKAEPSLKVVHRLDFGTSGVICFAKTAEAVRKLRESQDRWTKRYRCLVAGQVIESEGVIRKPLGARTHEGKVDAFSRYRVVGAWKLASDVEVQIETGRKHQVRQHMAMIGHPLLLDPLYGDKEKDRLFRRKFHYDRFFLHAECLQLPHPATGKMMSFVAPLPASYEKAVKELRERGH
jgi:RluA family pseudouridine synthase